MPLGSAVHVLSVTADSVAVSTFWAVFWGLCAAKAIVDEVVDEVAIIVAAAAVADNDDAVVKESAVMVNRTNLATLFSALFSTALTRGFLCESNELTDWLNDWLNDLVEGFGSSELLGIVSRA